MTSLNVEFSGDLAVVARNDAATPADTVKTLTVKATGAGTYSTTAALTRLTT
jgi:hypothetical protein